MNMMNQLVALIVGCVLFFWGISYFINKSLTGINNVQIAQSGLFVTQSYSKCASYLSGAEEYLQDIVYMITPTGDCFTTDFTVQPNIIPEWKIRLYYFREKIRTFIH